MCYHYFISVCLWYDIIDITRLLRMIYVLRLVLDGNSSREGLLLPSYEHLCDLSSYEHLCDRVLYVHI